MINFDNKQSRQVIEFAARNYHQVWFSPNHAYFETFFEGKKYSCAIRAPDNGSLECEVFVFF